MSVWMGVHWDTRSHLCKVKEKSPLLDGNPKYLVQDGNPKKKTGTVVSVPVTHQVLQ